MRAARAVPGGARPTPAPQGADVGPYFGRISPLAAQLANEHGYASTYGPFLPRPARTFTEGAFGPFSPILPVPVDAPPPGAELPDPRRFDYPVGWNLPAIPGMDGFRLASFETLDTLSRLHSITRTCIERRKNEIAGLDWDIVPTKEASKAYSGSHEAMNDFGKRRAEAIEFFRQPDPDRFPDWDAFIKALIEQVLVYDAMSLLIKPKRGRGLGRGILGSDLDCVNLIDGASIRPLLSLSGATPRPPAPAYQQYLKSVPRSDLQTMWNGQDIENAGLKGYEGPVFAVDQLLYRPTVPRINSPYGFSCVEMALIVIMTGLRKQAYQLQYYDSGTVPAVYISPGDTNMTPNQIRELQDALNAVAGDQVWHHQIIVLPPGAKVMPQRAVDLADQFDEYLANEIAMVFDVDPMSLGLIPKVSTVASPFAAREMSQASRSVHDRTSTKPLLKYLCSIFNTILHRVCGQDDMRFSFAGMDEAQDQAAMTDMLVKQLQNGVISIDEFREEIQRTPWGLDETSGPLVYTQGGAMPLNLLIHMTTQQMQVQGGQNSPANSGNSTDTRPRGVHHPPSSRPVGTHNPRQGLPSGSGMRTGLPSGAAPAVSDTPAHSAARGHQGAQRPSKAVRAELDSLARHLRKGRDIATWMPKYLSGVVMATIGEDLTKGIGVDEAVRGAMTVALPASEYEWADDVLKASSRQWPGWQQDQNLQQQYRQRIRQAFAQAAQRAKTLIRDWLTGVLAVTAAHLARMILEILAKILAAALNSLWREAWHMGRQAAHAILAEAEADWGGWEPGFPSSAGDIDGLAEWIASHGRDALEGIGDTRAEELAAYLAEQARSGASPDAIAAGIAEILDADARSDMISETELHRAEGAAAEQVFRAAGTAYKEWLIADSEACARCKANAAQGAIPFGEPFADGSYWTPGHPRCRCEGAGVPAPDLGKLARGRSVELNGQEWWPAGSYPHGPAMGGGGPMHAAHNAEGTQTCVPGGVPGMTAGGEHRRWPGGEAPAVVQDYEPGTGRVESPHGGGAVLAPYRDMSDETHTQSIEDGDDAAWPQHRGVPPRPGTYWPAPYMDGYWPRGGIGTEQAPGMSVGATDRRRPPNAVGKGASDLHDPSPVEAEHVYNQLAVNYPAKAIEWVRGIRWIGPVEIPLDRVDTDDEDSWAASHQPDAVARFAREIKAGTGHTNPVVMVQKPGHLKAMVVDGHHRFLACRKLGWPCKSYVGFVPEDDGPWDETHSSQVHQGDDPANKHAKVSPRSVHLRPAAEPGRRCGTCVMYHPHATALRTGTCDILIIDVGDSEVCDRWKPGQAAKGAKPDTPVAAGIAVRAADTGRILMLQRAFDEDDGAGGRWEFPGGCLEPGEEAFEAARREWAEETGCPIPDGELTGIWGSSNGKYRGFVLTVPTEDAVDILGSRDAVENPDDPDNDLVEALAWWEPGMLRDNPAVRDELAEDQKRVRRALKSAGLEKASARGRTSAEILREYWTHEGHPGPTRYALEQKIRWGEPDDWYRCHAELTPYIGEEGAKGYCNLRHHEVLGYWPAQHAEMGRGA